MPTWDFLQKMQIAVGTLHLTAGASQDVITERNFITYKLPTSTQTPQKLLFFQTVFSRRYANKYIESAAACFLAELFQPSSQMEIHCFCVFKLDVGLYE